MVLDSKSGDEDIQSGPVSKSFSENYLTTPNLSTPITDLKLPWETNYQASIFSLPGDKS